MFSGTRPPPPTYYEAVKYPITSRPSTNVTQPKYNLIYTQETNHIVADDKFHHVYQTLPGENVFLLQQPIHHYKNVSPLKSLVKFKYIHSYRSVVIGKPLLTVEALPETLASSHNHMGVKTYAQLEVIAADDNPANRHKLEDRNRGMCAEEGVSSCEAINERLGVGGLTRCSNDPPHSNGKAVLLPVNGIVGQDRMIVESLLCDINNDPITLNGSLDDLPPPPSEIYACCDNEDTESQTEHDRDNYTQALEREPKPFVDDLSLEPINALEDDQLLDTSNSSRQGEASGEITPLLQASNAQSNSSRLQSIDISTLNHRQKLDNDHEYADSGYSDCNRLEFKEHISEFNTDHVVENVIYSEPEYSSSDMSLKVAGDSTQEVKDKCQRTLKRTNNGNDHTVYELSPSESFCNTGDNNNPTGDKHNASIASSEGICRIGRSSSSCAEGTKGGQPLNRQSSVSFTKPLVVGPNGNGGDQNAVNDMQQPDPDADTEDGEPLVSPVSKNSVSSIPSHLVRIHTNLLPCVFPCFTISVMLAH